MPVKTAESCAEAFISNWISRCWLPSSVVSDNGNTFVAQLWKNINEALGIVVSYTPTYSAASLGGLERKHRDLKYSLKATLQTMGDQHGALWLRALPWILLGRRTAFQPELGTSSAELLYGQTPRIPGDIAGADLAVDSDLPHLLERMRTHAAQPQVQTAHHRTRPVYMPSDTTNATHVYVKRGKPTPLGPNFDGPFEILEKLGNSCLKIRVRSYANGQARTEVQNWINCKPAKFVAEPFEIDRPKPGRKQKQPSP